MPLTGTLGGGPLGSFVLGFLGGGGPTPLGNSQDFINQLLFTHPSDFIYDGVISTQLTGALNSPDSPLVDSVNVPQYFRMNGNVIAQPFLAVDTTITRVLVPLRVLSGIGQDVRVSLFTDDGGVPSGIPAGIGTPEVIVPGEFMVTGDGQFPDYYEPEGAVFVESNGLVLPSPATAFSNQVSISDGQFITYMGGVDGNGVLSNFEFTTAFGGKTLQPFTQSVTLPSVLADMDAATAGGIAVILGGVNFDPTPALPSPPSPLQGTSSAVHTSTYSAGVLSGWQAQAPFPNATNPYSNISGSMVMKSRTVDSNNVVVTDGSITVWLLGGYKAYTSLTNDGTNPTVWTTTTVQDGTRSGPTAWIVNEWVGGLAFWGGGSATVASNTGDTLTFAAPVAAPAGGVAFTVFMGSAQVWTNTVSSGGVINTDWTRLANLPATINNGMCEIVNGWLVIAGGVHALTGGVAVDNVYAAKIHADNTLGPWVTWPNLFNAQQGGVAGVFQDTMYVLGGIGVGGFPSFIFQGLAVGPLGPAAAWQSLPGLFNDNIANFGTHAAISNNGNLFGIGKENETIGQQTQLGNIAFVSVPLNVTGLTPGTKYHLTLTGDTSTLLNQAVTELNGFGVVGLPGSATNAFPAVYQVKGVWPAVVNNNNAITGGATSITFPIAPTGFTDGDIIEIAPGSALQESVTLLSGATTSTWTTSTISNSHGPNVLILEQRFRDSQGAQSNIIPIQIYTGHTGKLVHTSEDSGKKWSWMLYDKLTGDISAVGEYTDAIRSFFTYQYNGSVLVDSGSPRGWAHGAWGQTLVYDG